MTANCFHKGFTSEQAEAVAELLEIDLAGEGIELEEFRRGMEVELEHGRRDSETNVTNDDPVLTGKIALAHLRELPDYYERLDEMERAQAGVTDIDARAPHDWWEFEHQSAG